jgi:hypothetical protein
VFFILECDLKRGFKEIVLDLDLIEMVQTPLPSVEAWK